MVIDSTVLRFPSEQGKSPDFLDAQAGLQPHCSHTLLWLLIVSTVPGIRWFPDKKNVIVHENISCGDSLEAPCQGASNEYPQHIFSWTN